MPTIRFTNRLDRCVECPDDTGVFLAVGTTTSALFNSGDGGHSWDCSSSHLPHIYAVQIG